MAAAAGELLVKIAADLADFRSDLNKATRMAEDWGRTFKSAVAGAVAGLAGGLTVGAFAKLTRDAIDNADAVGKMAQKIGVSTEALSTYTVAARLADVSNEQLRAGFDTLNKNQADFVNGTGRARTAFEALGITTAQVKGLQGDTAKIFELVAGKLAQYEDSANKSALATKILGGTDLIPLINSLQEAKKEAAEFGAVIDKQTAAAAEQFNDNMTRSKLAVEAWGLGIAKGVLPTLVALSERLVATAKDTQGIETAARIADTGLKLLVTGGTIVSTVFKFVGERIGAVAASLVAMSKGELRQALDIQLQSFGDMQRTVSDAVGSIQATWDTAADRIVARAPETGRKLAAPALAATEETKKAAERIGEELRKFFEDSVGRMSMRGVIKIEREKGELDQAQFKALVEFGDASVRPLDRVRALNGRINEQMRDRANEARRELDSTIELQQKVQEIADLVKGGFLSPDEGEALFERLNVQWMQAAAAANSYGDNVDKAAELGKEFGLTMSSAFEQAAIEGRSLSEVIKALGQDIARMVLRKTVTEPLGNAISSWAGELFKGFKFFADGGYAAAGQPAIVGEMGPELFMPASAGSIVPHDALARAMGTAPLGGDVFIRNARNGGNVRIQNHIVVQGNGVTMADVARAVTAGSRATMRAVAESRKR